MQVPCKEIRRKKFDTVVLSLTEGPDYNVEPQTLYELSIDWFYENLEEKKEEWIGELLFETRYKEVAITAFNKFKEYIKKHGYADLTDCVITGKYLGTQTKKFHDSKDFEEFLLKLATGIVSIPK